MAKHKQKQLALVSCIVFLTLLQFTDGTWRSQAAALQELPLGFKAFPDSSVSSNFQPLLTDSSGNYSLGFLKVNGTSHHLLSLSVVHVPSSVRLWSATATLARWGHPTQLSFNGSLVLSDTKSGVFWSTNSMGSRVVLSSDSNLVITTAGGDSSHNNNIVWQSFDFPSDTLVENQNFTSNMSLVSSNGLYSMRLGPDYIGLYADFFSNSGRPGQIYLRHKALEAKADIIQGMPVYVILKPDGYLGMFQNGSSIPADVQSFNTFQQNATGIRRVRLETDGNLKGYYWTGSDWVMEYQAISDSCELPSSCGSYGLCRSGKGCSCLEENRTAHDDHDDSLVCEPVGLISGDFCNVYEDKFRIIRRNGVDLPFKELMGYEKMESFQECENSCEKNCSCWGVVYSNSSGFCYAIDYPIQSLVAVGDDSKMGYFKVRVSVGKKRMGTWLGLGLGLLLGAVLILLGVLGLGWKRMKRRGVKRYVEEDGGVGVGPYKDLGAASFRSIELCEK